MKRPERWAAAAALMLCCACGGSSTTEIEHPDGEVGQVIVTFSSSASLHDTIGAPVELSVLFTASDGTPVPGLGVTLDSPTQIPGSSERAAYFCPLGFQTCNGTVRETQVVVTTDASGEASMDVVLGGAPGTGWLRASIAAVAIEDSIDVEVSEGQPAAIVASPSDTTVYVGHSATLRFDVSDRLGNPLPSFPAPTLTSLDPDLSTSGAEVSGVSFGQGQVEVAIFEARDTVSVIVPPEGTLVAYWSGHGITASLVQVELDGSGFRTLVETESLSTGIWPVFAPDGRVVYEGGVRGDERLWVIDTAGVAERLTSGDTPTTQESYVAWGPSGIYFSAGGNPEIYGPGIWRVAAPGDLPEYVAPPHVGTNPFSNGGWRGSLSPDGQRLVYHNFDQGLSVRDLTTGDETPIAGGIRSVQWSPLGDLILYVVDVNVYDKAIHLITPDGTDMGTVLEGHPWRDGRAMWSPDGQWLITRDDKGMCLVRLADGLLLHPTWAEFFSSPAWG